MRAALPAANGSLLLRQHTLAACHLPLSSRVSLGGHAQRPRIRLERGLNDVVGVPACQLPDVQRHARGVDHRLEEVVNHLRVERSNAFGWNLQIVSQIRPPRQVLQNPLSQVPCVCAWCLGGAGCGVM